MLRKASFRISLAASVVVLLCADFVMAQPQYEAVRIIPDTSFSAGYNPVRLNDSGQVLMTMGLQTFLAPRIWHGAADSLEELSGFSGWGVEALSLNRLGNICGYFRDAESAERAFYWSNGSRRVLEPENNQLDSSLWGGRAKDINNNEAAVGLTSTIAMGTQGAFWPSPDQKAEVLDPLDGFTKTDAYALNDAGSIVGISYFAAPGAIVGSGATLWPAGGGPESIEFDAPAGRQFAVPTDINNADWIVGWDIGNGFTSAQAVLIRGNEVTVLHDSTQSGSFWRATAINDSGMIVGHTDHPFLWQDGVHYDLNDLIAGSTFTDGTPLQPITGATDINNKGEILCGTAFYRVLLRPITIPPGIIVNSNGDVGDADPNDGRCWTGNMTPLGDEECTFRAAIEHANQAQGRDTIVFDIPDNDAVIRPLVALPTVTDVLEIDGTSQPGMNYIEVSGVSTYNVDDTNLAVDGLTVQANGAVVRGLRLRSFSGNGLVLRDADSITVERCILGSDTLSSSALATEAFDGNDANGLLIEHSSHDRVGETFENGNIITYNGLAGIFVSESSSGNTFRENAITANGGLGIDLFPVGVNRNDSADVDEGANRRQNYPVIDSVVTDGLSSTIYGRATSSPVPNAVLVEFFVVDSCDSSGFGEGMRKIWSTQFNVTGPAPVPFSTTTSYVLQNDEFLTATSTDQDGNTSEFSYCWPRKDIRIVDVNGAPIAEKTFALYRVANDVPDFTETFIDSITTNADGVYRLDSLIRAARLALGDSIKVIRHMHAEPALLHTDELGTAYSIRLDNMRFDSTTHAVSFDEIEFHPIQDIKLDHTTIAFDLVVGVRWRSEPGYLETLRQGFYHAANHLFDVSDGQVTLDTVIIRDNAGYVSDSLDELDFVVEENNHVYTLDFDPQSGPPPDRGRLAVRLGRSFYVDELDARNASELPPDAAHIENYRLLGWVIARYCLGLKSEQNRGSLTCSGSHFGFMGRNSHNLKSNLIGDNIELSQEHDYHASDVSCFNTAQYRKYARSCWDFLEKTRFEGEYDGIFVPIVKPTERPGVAQGGSWGGPNEGFDTADRPLQYDAGAHAILDVRDDAAHSTDLLVSVLNVTEEQRTAGVTIIYKPIHPTTSPEVWMGKTSQDGKLLAVGVTNGSILTYSRNATLRTEEFSWSFAETDLDEEFAHSNAKRAAPSTDLAVLMQQVQGSYPAINALALDESGGAFSMVAAKMFSSEPTLTVTPASGQAQQYELTATIFGYQSEINTDMGFSGSFRIDAIDDSGSAYAYPVEYSISEFSAETILRDAESRSGYASFELDELNAAIERVAILSTPYPPLRNGIDSASWLVGNVYAISVDPLQPLSGENLLRVSYAESDIVGTGTTPYTDETSIRMYHWNDVAAHWDLIGGSVDSAANAVVASITEDGVYAAFTTSMLPDNVAPTITIGVAQNPVLPSRIRIYVVSDEPLAAPPELTAGGELLAVQTVAENADPTFVADYILTGSGTITLRAVASDLAANEADVSLEFESFPAGSVAQTWTAQDGLFQLYIPQDALAGERRILYFRDSGELGMTHDLRPHAQWFVQPAQIRIAPSAGEGNPSGDIEIVRARVDGTWEGLATSIDAESGSLTAYTDRLGVFAIRTKVAGRSSLPRRASLGQNYPNPFNASTVIEFTLGAADHARLDVFNILGQVVTTLVDESLDTGTHRLFWDGTDREGRSVASGVYLYRLQTSDRSQVRRMILLK